MKHTLWTIAFGVLLSPVALGCKAKAPPSPATSETTPRIVRFDPAALTRLGVATAKVCDGSDAACKVTSATEAVFQVPGTLEFDPDHYAEVGTIADGRVTELVARVGQRVKKGDLLARISMPAVAEVQAEYLTAEAASRIAVQNQKREQDLLSRDLTTAREAEVAEGETARSHAALLAARAKLAAFGVHPTGQGGSSLTAPLDGVVVRRDAVLGRYLRANETAFVVADTKVLQAELNVYESDSLYIKEGTDLTLVIESPKREIRAKVSRMDPRIGRGSRVLRAHLVVDNADESLRAGVMLQAKVPLSGVPSTNSIRIPAESVQRMGDENVIFVQRAVGEFEVRRVEVLRRTAQVVETSVRESLNGKSMGVSGGEVIVTTGSFLLRGEALKQ